MALVGNFDAVLTAGRETDGASFALDAGFLAAAARACVRTELAEDADDETESGVPGATIVDMPALPELRDAMSLAWRILLRSEEHTSELQSLMRISYAVFCLKKKIKNITHTLKHNTLQ